mmetsp:Transcript_38402/g.68682  ORF Transcript_38402/g.68682 Transcript_38402/m.68682 type:complete len:244 (-) Transcript_38402:272-1003(-)
MHPLAPEPLVHQQHPRHHARHGRPQRLRRRPQTAVHDDTVHQWQKLPERRPTRLPQEPLPLEPVGPLHDLRPAGLILVRSHQGYQPRPHLALFDHFHGQLEDVAARDRHRAERHQHHRRSLPSRLIHKPPQPGLQLLHRRRPQEDALRQHKPRRPVRWSPPKHRLRDRHDQRRIRPHKLLPARPFQRRQPPPPPDPRQLAHPQRVLHQRFEERLRPVPHQLRLHPVQQPNRVRVHRDHGRVRR